MAAHKRSKTQPAQTPLALLEELCEQIDPKHDSEKLFGEGDLFADAAVEIRHHLESFQDEISKISLLAIILYWSKLMAKDRLFGERNIKMMLELIHAGLIETIQKGRLRLLKEVTAADHLWTIDCIRCHIAWPIVKREDFVSLYLEFSSWLAAETHNCVLRAEDPDRKMASRRLVPFETYIKLLTEFSPRERILTKLFYLGGERTLDEILTLNIKDVKFPKFSISFSDHVVRYPAHVFKDLKEFIGKRSSGYLFLGRSGERLSHTTPYRVLKVVTTKLGLDPSFSFKDLVKEI